MEKVHVIMQENVRESSMKDKKLYIGGLFPITGTLGWLGGQACFPAVKLALEDVNNRHDLLPRYLLELVHNDSKCQAGLGTNVMYDLLYTEPVKIMMMTGCSSVSTFVAQAARMWNLVVLSYGSSSPALSNRERYPTFFRTHPSAVIHNPTRIKLFKRFEWKRIATIVQTEEVWTSTMNDLESQVKDHGIEIVVRQSFSMDPSHPVKNLKRQDARIIVGLFYEYMARRVFCQAYKEGLYGRKYVWWIVGWYPDNWYEKRDEDDKVDCTVEQMKEVLQGHFTTEMMMYNQDDVKTESGMTSMQFDEKLKVKLREKYNNTQPEILTGYPEAPLAYDAVWAIAHALNKTMNRLAKKNMLLEDFTYNNTEIKDEIYVALNDTKFLGVSGPVAFSSKGDRIAWTQIEQMWDGKYYKVGFYHEKTDNLTWKNTEKWIGGRPPSDRTEVVKQLRTVSQVLFFAMCILAAVGIIAGLACLVFNTMHRHSRYIQLSHPIINNIAVIGCMICFLCVFLVGLDGRYVSEDKFDLLCQARAWVLSVGFTLAYGAMFSKIWTIYRLTTRRKKEIKYQKANDSHELKNYPRLVVHSWEMYLVIGLLLLLDVILLAIWQLMSPLERELEDFALEDPLDSEKDIKLLPQLEHCSCENINVWLGVMYGYKGILLLFGVLLAYETRSVKMKQLNDSRFVAMAIYNVVVLCIITAPVTLIIGSQQDATFAFVAVAIILCCLLSMGLIFVPKVVELIRNPDNGLDSKSVIDSLASKEEEERHQRLVAENEETKQLIAEKEAKIKELNLQLQLKSQKRLQLCLPNDEDTGNHRGPPRVATDHENNGCKTHLLSTSFLKPYEDDGDITIDPDSAMPTCTSSTAFSKSSKLSGSSENYSESYC
ncbi:unnamed protein product [Owenia fusiformis]|uniref:G-protein coupled receptors family 3 profile domain-containing protein n=1 Tax=Owenia fusiformis TaxID=6347 RepID=A0A8S4P413_OWEFU|nr:unnamed protein product [Owenia fusiformis]